MRMGWIVALLLLASVLVVGCRTRAVVVDPPGPGPDVVVVKRAPPPAPAVRIVKPPRPGPRYTWVPGHYTYSGGSYHWTKGHWKVPPRRSAVWVPGHYSVSKGHWVRGRWR